MATVRELAVALALLVPATGFVAPAVGFVVEVAGFIVVGGRVVVVAGFTAGFAVAVLAPAVDLAGVTGGLGAAAARLVAPPEAVDRAGDRTAVRAFARDEAVAPAGVLGRDAPPAGVFGRAAPLAGALSVDAFGTGGRRGRAGVDPDPDAAD